MVKENDQEMTETTNSSSGRSKGGMPTYTIILLIAGAFVVGMFWNRMQSMEKEIANLKTNPTANTTGTTTTQGTGQAAQAAQQQQQPTVNEETIKSLFNDKNVYFGDPSSANLFVEVADPSCPYCHVAAGKNPSLNTQIGPQFTLVESGGTYVAPVPEMKKLVDEGKAALVWLYTPGHGNGELGTKALYCAHDQGKFWEAHDKLMTSEGYTLLNDQVKNDKTKSQQLVDFIGGTTNKATLKDCLDSGKYDGKLAEDTAVARSLGANGTPGFFVNTTNFAGAYSWNDMKNLVK